MKNRSAIDIVIILMTAMVAAVLVISTLAISIGRMIHPEADFKSGAEVIGNIVTTVVGALVGFIGGRATGKLEANGKEKTNGEA